MPAIPITHNSHTFAHTSPPRTPPTALPQLLQTPLGLALLEIQGTLNLPSHNSPNSDARTAAPGSTSVTQIGRLVFPNLSSAGSPGSEGIPSLHSETAEEGPWMKHVHLYIGQNQRLTGEVKKLKTAVAILRRSPNSTSNGMGQDGEGKEELEIMDIVRYKLFFGSRPEFV